MVTIRDNRTFSVTFSDLRFNTQYNCCVEALYYTDSTRDAPLCATERTEEGGDYLSLEYMKPFIPILLHKERHIMITINSDCLSISQREIGSFPI